MCGQRARVRTLVVFLAVLPGITLSFRGGFPRALAPGARAMWCRAPPLVMSVRQDSSDLQVESDFGYSRLAIDRRFSSQPLEVAQRTGQVLAAVARVKLAGDADGGQTLRRELALLGPVFCKVGQTLATRPDIVGAETSRKLGQLQDAMAPEPDSATAFATLRSFLREQGSHSKEAGDPIDAVFTEISREPVAAASLAEVYRATTREGVEVAVKIQRPGLEKKIALDFYVLLKLLGLAQKRFQISESLDIVEAVLDEVGAGIFKELDFRQEARHIRAFQEMYAAELEDLGVIVPRVLRHLTGKQVLVTEWIAGRAPRDLPPRERAKLAKTAVKCLAMQLMSKGFIHCDPHEGNLLALPDGYASTLHPTPYALRPTPYTLRPTPCTLHPAPYTLHLLALPQGESLKVTSMSDPGRDALIDYFFEAAMPSLIIFLRPRCPH
jgi:predicted unusual protein kinase regulating ubiquinone biosynthesis (AarF/ABC1/UbiB family)